MANPISTPVHVWEDVNDPYCVYRMRDANDQLLFNWWAAKRYHDPKDIIRERDRIAYIGQAINEHEPLKQQVEELKGEVKRLTEWRLAYERLTPQGSEWVNDLPKCEAYVQQRMATGQKAEMRLVKAERELSQLSNLRKVEAELRRGLEVYADYRKWSYEDIRGHDMFLESSGKVNGFDLAQQTLAKADEIAKEG